MNKHLNAPEALFEELFVDLHRAQVLEDGKAISDAIPKFEPAYILANYRKLKVQDSFSIKAFFKAHFSVQASPSSGFISDTNRPVEEHIESLWNVLQREADQAVKGSSLIPLPHPYIVPGGRFNEIYYWDSYFTMLGLEVSGRYDLIENMLDNFTHLIGQFGFIPNGNRTYFASRSQPPFFSLMVDVLAAANGDEVYIKYKPFLLKEYQFWMNGSNNIKAANDAIEHLVALKDYHLNRYFDRNNNPRAEMYFTDEEDLTASNRQGEDYFASIRAACESGWDFSSRWLDASLSLSSIATSDILPVDLNALLWHLESTLSRIETDISKKQAYAFAASKRKKLINEVFWNKEASFYFDFNFKKQNHCSVHSLAAMFPLFFSLADQEQAASVAKVIENDFLKAGGLISTTLVSGQQWDAPNGWAPLQWISIVGLRNYGFNDLADEVKKRWTTLNIRVYKNTGKLLEKYNVVDVDLESGGGEYPVQDGFGWTNGVLLKLLKETPH